jgi:transposase-like protein
MTPAQRRGLVSRWLAVGVPASAFAARYGVHFTSLYRWRRELDRDGTLVEVVAADPRDPREGPVFAWNVEVALPSGAILRVGDRADEELLRRVARALS